MKNYRKILIIIQRSNGDVFFTNSLVFFLRENYPDSTIHLLVNDDTYHIAKLIPGVNKIYQFSYKKKEKQPLKQEFSIIRQIYKKYDLSINLTSSDRSVLYAALSSNFSISSIEDESRKSWWKKLILSKYYYFNPKKHIILNNLTPLNILGLPHKKKVKDIPVKKISPRIQKLIDLKGFKNFIIFHPSAQYHYKIYPTNLRNELLLSLAKKNKIIVTGGNSHIDLSLSKSIPQNENILNLIGKTSIEEYMALSKLSLCYIGMDTLNMHIAASQDKEVFAIFGPTNIKMWSPWSNLLETCASFDQQFQSYGRINIFQANLPCVACGKAGCNDQHDKSLCLDYIDPNSVLKKVESFLNV